MRMFDSTIGFIFIDNMKIFNSTIKRHNYSADGVDGTGSFL
jgi:hypothetical protein